MSFEYPEFFLLALIVPLLIVGAILAARARGLAWRQLIAERLRPILVHERGQARRWITLAVYLLAFALLIAALTAPNAGYRETEEIIRGRDILLAVDVSRSMLAGDESPSRISAARAAALDILERFPNDRVGIIAFSDVAWLQAPLTIDHDALRQTLQQLDFLDSGSEWLPRGGSNLAAAVNLAVQTVRETGHRDNTLVILSDGEAHSGDLDGAADEAAEIGLTIFAAGFGTTEGAFIPDLASRDGKLHDRDGNLVLTRLDEDSLRLLARRTGGFFTMGSGAPFSSNLEVAVQRMERYEQEGRLRRVAIPRFQWFLAPSMILFVVGMLLDSSWRFGQRPAAAAAALVVAMAGFAAAPARAGILPPTEAEQAYAAGDHRRALELFAQEAASANGERRSRLQLGEAAAAYRLADYNHASRAYSGALLSDKPAVQEEAHFGLGNTQYLKGEALLQRDGSQKPPDLAAIETTVLFWRDSIAHFEAVLALDPTSHRARENRDFVQRRLDDLLKQKEQLEREEQERSNQQSKEQEDPQQPTQGEAQHNDRPEPPTHPDPDGEGQPPDRPPPTPPDHPEPNHSPPPESEDNPPDQADLNPRPGESPEEFARRILDENSDFQARPIPMRHRRHMRPDRDW